METQTFPWKSSLRILFFSLFILFFHPLFTQAAQPLDGLGQAALNNMNDENHELERTFTGHLITEYEEFVALESDEPPQVPEATHIVQRGVDYSIKINTQVASPSSSHHKVSLEFIHAFENEVLDQSPETLTQKMEGEVLKSGENFYFKVNNLSLEAAGVNEAEKKDFEAFQNELKSEYAGQFNTWVRLDLESFFTLIGSPRSPLESKEIEEKFKKVLSDSTTKPDEVIFQLVDLVLQEMESTRFITPQKKEMASIFFKGLTAEKSFFSYHLSPAQEGSKRLIMNRFLIHNTIQKLMEKELAGHFDEEQKKFLLEFLKKMRLSFQYKLDEEGLMKDFTAYFNLKDFQNIKEFELNYKQNLVSKEGVQSLPDPQSSIPFQDWLKGFNKSQPYENEYSDLSLGQTSVVEENFDPNSFYSNEVVHEAKSLMRGHEPFLGSEDAPVTVVTFFDLQDPYSKRFFTEVFPKIKKEYVDTNKVKFVFKSFPMKEIYPESYAASVANRCAFEGGGSDAYYRFQQGLFSNDLLNEDVYTKLAVELGLNKDDFVQCVRVVGTNTQIEKDVADGQKLGVAGTPAFFISGRMVLGDHPFVVFKALMEEALVQ